MEEPKPGLTGPESIAIASTSWRGPFAGAARVRLMPRTVRLVNAAALPDEVEGVTLDALRDGRSGLAVEPALVATRPASSAVDPGTSLPIGLCGEVPARPGTYLSVLRVRGRGGTAAVPVSVAVSASAAWGIALMLLGLSLVNLLGGLAGESETATRLREVLQARAAAHEWLGTHPPADSRAEDVADMDRSFDAAVAALDRPRLSALVDRRDADAAAPLRAAEAAFDALRQSAPHPLLAGIVEDLAHEWSSLEGQLRDIAAMPTAAGGDGFPGRLDGVVRRVRERLLVAPGRYVSAELASQLARVRLAAAAGEGDGARALAIAVRRWMHRSARGLQSALRLIAREQIQAAYVLGTDMEIRRDATRSGIADDVRAGILAKLDAAEAMLGDGADLPQLRDASRAMNADATELAAAVGRVELVRVQAAIAAAGAEAPFDAVQQASEAAQADPDHAPAHKIVRLRGILDVWRGLIGTVADDPTRAALMARVDAVSALLDAGTLKEVAAPYRALTDAWAEYGTRRVAQAVQAAQRPYCDAYVAHIQRRIGYLEQDLRWEDAGSRLAGWEQALDAIRLDLDRLPATGDCLGPILALDRREGDLGNQVFAAAADTSGVASATRREALGLLGPGAALAADLPRALTVAARTPEPDRVVGRRILFDVGNLDPDWGPGVQIRLDYGDGSPPLRSSAESLRQATLDHAYARPVGYRVTVDASEAGGAALLGEGTASVLVAPAPEETARALADRFLSARFALALLVALVVYYWRFHSRAQVFGARGFDYVEAFALGFAVNAAVAELPKALAAFVPG